MMKLYRFLTLLVLPFALASCQQQQEKEQEESLISLSHTAITLSEDQTFQLSVTVDDSLKNNLVFWNMRDEDIATVEDGLVTAKKEGSTICSVQVGKYVANCAVNVTAFEPVDALDISIEFSEITLNVYDTYELPIIVTLGNSVVEDYQLTADVSDNTIVEIENKTITALEIGECTILLTATYESYTSNELITVTVC